MERRDFLRLTLTTGLAATLDIGIAEAQSAEEHGPNILWFMLDDGRPDSLGCYGHPWAKTPNIDALATHGVRFQSAVTQCPICVPSRTSMKTAHYPHQTGVIYMGDPPATTPPYAASQRDFPNLLNAWPGAGIPLTNVGKRHAFQQDFDHKGDPGHKKPHRPGQGKTYPEVNLTTHGWRIGGTIDIHPEDIRTGQLGQLALDTLKALADAGKTFFLRVSFHAPHVPIQVPPSFMIDPDDIDLPFPSQKELDAKPRFEREQLRVYAGTLDLTEEQIRNARGAYYGMVALVDHQVGNILALLRKEGLLDNTLITFNSDQGLEMGVHGVHKKRCFYEQTIGSPLIFNWPGHLPEGKVIQGPIEMTNFVPTLMDACNFDVPADICGKSLMPLMTGEQKTWHTDAAFAEIDHSGSMYDELRVNSGRRVMIRTPKWMLEYFKDPRVQDKDGALYDLENDPQECFNLYNDPQYKDTIAQLEARVDEWDTVPG